MKLKPKPVGELHLSEVCRLHTHFVRSLKATLAFQVCLGFDRDLSHDSRRGISHLQQHASASEGWILEILHFRYSSCIENKSDLNNKAFYRWLLELTHCGVSSLSYAVWRLFLRSSSNVGRRAQIPVPRWHIILRWSSIGAGTRLPPHWALTPVPLPIVFVPSVALPHAHKPTLPALPFLCLWLGRGTWVPRLQRQISLHFQS